MGLLARILNSVLLQEIHFSNVLPASRHFDFNGGTRHNAFLTVEVRVCLRFQAGLEQWRVALPAVLCPRTRDQPSVPLIVTREIGRATLTIALVTPANRHSTRLCANQEAKDRRTLPIPKQQGPPCRLLPEIGRR